MFWPIYFHCKCITVKAIVVFSSFVSNAVISHIKLTWLLTIQSTQQCVTGAFLVIMINSISRNKSDTNNERPGLQEVRIGNSSGARPSWRGTRGKDHMLDKEPTAEGARINLSHVRSARTARFSPGSWTHTLCRYIVNAHVWTTAQNHQGNTLENAVKCSYCSFFLQCFKKSLL